MSHFITFLKYFFKPLHVSLFALGIFGTYVSVATGFDWWYFLFTYKYVSKSILFIADGLGFLIPIFLPIGFYLYSRRTQNVRCRETSIVIVLAAAAGLTFSMVIKMFTGRISPPHHGPFDIDISGAFQFGFMEHHIIGGYPSSHATVAFAIATAIALLFREKKWVGVYAYIVASLIGIGVTFGFHWFSEFLMGSLLGYVLGSATYITFKKDAEV